MHRTVFDDIELPNGKTRSYTVTEIRKRARQMAPHAFRCLERNLYSSDDKVQVAAATAILDRAGFGPQSKITVEDERDNLTELTPQQLAARARQLAEQIEANNAISLDGPFNEDVEEGQVH